MQVQLIQNNINPVDSFKGGDYYQHLVFERKLQDEDFNNGDGGTLTTFNICDVGEGKRIKRIISHTVFMNDEEKLFGEDMHLLKKVDDFVELNADKSAVVNITPFLTINWFDWTGREEDRKYDGHSRRFLSGIFNNRILIKDSTGFINPKDSKKVNDADVTTKDFVIDRTTQVNDAIKKSLSVIASVLIENY